MLKQLSISVRIFYGELIIAYSNVLALLNPQHNLGRGEEVQLCLLLFLFLNFRFTLDAAKKTPLLCAVLLKVHLFNSL